MIRRAVVAAAAVAAIGAVVVSARLGGEEPMLAAPFSGEVTPAAQPVACPGPVEIPVGEIEGGDPALGSGSDDRAYAAEGGADGTEPLGAGFLVRGDAGASVERIGAGDVAGLAAASCAAPTRDQWLVGGSTTLGSSARLVLSNPSDATTEATVTYYGPLGKLEERTVATLAAGAQREILLEGVVPEVSALAMRVVATGAGVVAHLQDSRLDGFQAAGTDWVGRGAVPSTSLVVPGVGGAGAESTLRIMAPEGATASLALTGEDGIVEWGGVTALTLEPGVVTEVEVPQVEGGAIEISADFPVVAAAMMRVPREIQDGPAGSFAYDLAWAAAQDVSDRLARSVVVTDHATAVTVHAPATADFELTDDSGAVVASTTVTARTSATIPLEVAPGTTLTAQGRFTWVLVLEDEPGFLARVAPRRTDVEPLVVEVGQRPYVGPVAVRED